jgi:hypothetical protein
MRQRCFVGVFGREEREMWLSLRDMSVCPIALGRWIVGGSFVLFSAQSLRSFWHGEVADNDGLSQCSRMRTNLSSSMLPWSSTGKIAFANWGAFCRQVVEGGVQSVGIWMEKDGSVKDIKLADLGMTEKREDGLGREIDLDDLTVEKLLRKQKSWRVKLEGRLRGHPEFSKN